MKINKFLHIDSITLLSTYKRKMPGRLESGMYPVPTDEYYRY